MALAVFRHRAGGVLVGYWSGDAWRACGLVGNWCAVVEAAAVFGGLEW